MPPNSPNYYDDQFAQRINQIAKPGATPPRLGKGRSSGNGAWGVKGMGGIIAIVVLVAMRVLFSAHSSNTYSPPTYQYTPPTFTVPNQRFELPPDRFQDNGWEDAKDKPLGNEGKEPDIKDNR